MATLAFKNTPKDNAGLVENSRPHSQLEAEKLSSSYENETAQLRFPSPSSALSLNPINASCSRRCLRNDL
ncbi:MAG: hypothetical protein ACKESB_01315 [Candidatus Hodgkinia cicadicola]